MSGADQPQGRGSVGGGAGGCGAAPGSVGRDQGGGGALSGGAEGVGADHWGGVYAGVGPGAAAVGCASAVSLSSSGGSTPWITASR